MKYDFLKQFPRRMKQAGMYSLLAKKCAFKDSFTNYGLNDFDERINLVYSILLFVMDRSLTETLCTIDDISEFCCWFMEKVFGISLTFEESYELSDFVINVVLSNEGHQMFFSAYDFEKEKYVKHNIRYIGNSVYEGEIKKTCYHLTDDGYNLLLSTLEIENNMKLTIQELIFKMHFERKSYEEAEEDIKNIFNILRIQLKKMDEAMEKIRRNALEYSVADYKHLLSEDLDTIRNTKKKFTAYKKKVDITLATLKNKDVNECTLEEEEKKNLESLDTINRYLVKSLDEHQEILNKHYDVKLLYDRELIEISKLSMIHRFSIRKDFYEKIYDNPESLDRMEIFLRPLLNKDPNKVYNINKAFEVQLSRHEIKETDTEEVIDFDIEKWEEENERRINEKMSKYKSSIKYIIRKAMAKGSVSLLELRKGISEDEISLLIPTAEIFKEIMVEFLKTEYIDISELKKEKSDYIISKSEHFQLNEMILSLLENEEDLSRLSAICVRRNPDSSYVYFDDVQTASGNKINIRCSDLLIEIKMGGDTDGI